jgi:ABC-type Zn uptake system ZnuABC Zn-binding protein ZnuA
VGTAEPVPGIPPTAKHLTALVQIAKRRRVPLLLQESYFSDDAGKFLARQTGLRLVRVTASCESPQAGSYLAHIEQVVRLLAGTGVTPDAGRAVKP